MNGKRLLTGVLSVILLAISSLTVNAQSEWSEWVDTLPADIDSRYETEERTVYSYRDKSHKTSTSSSMEGWTKEKEPTTTWGAWSAWQDSKVTSSSTRKVETRQVGNGTYTYLDNPGSPYPIPTRTLSRGGNNKGDDVKWIQKFANDIMGAGIAVDGIYGADTEWAVKVFQENNGLTPDFVLGPQTRAKVLEVWKNATKKENKKTQYRYQDSTTTYYWYKWSDWSEWSDEQPEAKTDREIENKTQYRYRKIIKNIESAEIKLDKTTYVYNGTAFTPVPTVTYDGTTLVAGKDYEVTYANNISAGQGIVTVSGKDFYSGQKTVKFTIENPSTTQAVATTEAGTIYQTAQAGKVSLVTMDEQEEISIDNEKGGTDSKVKKKSGSSTGKKISKGTVFESKKASYKVTDTKKKAVTYVSAKKNVSEIKIPDTIIYKNKEYAVTQVAPGAFKNNKKMKKLVIGKNVKKIGKNAFRGCKKLETVTFGKNVTSIGAYAFYGDKKLTTLRFGTRKLNKVGKKAFGKIGKHPNAKVPKEKLTKYQKLIKKAL